MQCLRLGQMRITYRRLGLSVTTYSPYKVLDIKPGATKKEIKKAYRDKVKQCHPDLHPDDPKKEAQFRQVQEAYEAIMDGSAKSSSSRTTRSARHGSGRPFREDKSSFTNEAGEQEWHPGFDFEHNWKQRMKMREEWERQSRAYKDRERNAYHTREEDFQEKYGKRAQRVHERLNEDRFKEYDEEVMRELQRLKREEYDEFMRRRQAVAGNPRVKILGKLLVILMPCWLFVLWVYEEKHRSFEDRIQRDAQMRSAVAWNQSTREVFNQRQRLKKQNELISEEEEKLDDQNRAILDTLEHNSEVLKRSIK